MVEVEGGQKRREADIEDYSKSHKTAAELHCVPSPEAWAERPGGTVLLSSALLFSEGPEEQREAPHIRVLA